MHIKRCLFLLALLTLLVSTIPALAQDTNWFVYLYNGGTKELVRVNTDGSQTAYALGLDANTYVSAYDMTFTPDGSRVALCGLTYSENSPQGVTTLYFRDIANQTNILQIDLGNSIGCRTGKYALSDDGTQLAVGLIRYFPTDATVPDAPPMDTSGPAWEVKVYDIASGNLVNEMNATTPAASIAGELSGGAFLPDVRYFANKQIIFAEMPYGIGGALDMPVYLWTLADGSLQPYQWYGNPGVDFLPTGELIWIDDDPGLPAAEPMGPIGFYNVLLYADKSGEPPRLIYHSPDWTLADAKFINNGQQIAVLLLPGFDPNNPEMQPSKWVALDRAGTVTGLATVPNYAQLLAAPNGYVLLDFTFQNPAEYANPLYTLRYGTTTLWQNAPADPSVNWELAWVTPSPMAEGLQPFPAFAV